MSQYNIPLSRRSFKNKTHAHLHILSDLYKNVKSF